MTAGNKKYLIAFLITTTIFASALLVSNYFSQKRIENIRDIQKTISTNILSLETQFELLEESSCEYIRENPVLSGELNALTKRLSYMEGQLGSDDSQVKELKKSYSLLEIKDYMLMKRISRKCEIKPIFILYFYSNKDDCSKCEEMGHILTHLREEYPKLRVYSFDYHLELAALDTLMSINNIKHELPAMVVNDKVVHGFKDLEKMKEMLPMQKLEERSTSTPNNNRSTATPVTDD